MNRLISPPFLLLVLCGCAGQGAGDAPMHETTPDPVENESMDPPGSAQGRVVHGYRSYRAPGLEIRWSGPGSSYGAQPSGVLRATRDHLQYLQGNGQGGDELAKAIFSVTQAIDHLEGTGEVTSKPLDPSSPEFGNPR